MGECSLRMIVKQDPVYNMVDLGALAHHLTEDREFIAKHIGIYKLDKLQSDKDLYRSPIYSHIDLFVKHIDWRQIKVTMLPFWKRFVEHIVPMNVMLHRFSRRDCEFVLTTAKRDTYLATPKFVTYMVENMPHDEIASFITETLGYVPDCVYFKQTQFDNFFSQIIVPTCLCQIDINWDRVYVELSDADIDNYVNLIPTSKLSTMPHSTARLEKLQHVLDWDALLLSGSLTPEQAEMFDHFL